MHVELPKVIGCWLSCSVCGSSQFPLEKKVVFDMFLCVWTVMNLLLWSSWIACLVDWGELIVFYVMSLVCLLPTFLGAFTFQIFHGLPDEPDSLALQLVTNCAAFPCTFLSWSMLLQVRILAVPTYSRTGFIKTLQAESFILCGMWLNFPLISIDTWIGVTCDLKRQVRIIASQETLCHDLSLIVTKALSSHWFSLLTCC